MKNFKTSLILLAAVLTLCSCDSSKSPKMEAQEPAEKTPAIPLSVGYALGIQNFDSETLEYSGSVGVDYVEVSGMGMFVDKDGNFKMSDDKIVEILTEAREAADKAGIKIWSVHMPFGKNIDLSLLDEEDRLEVVSMHKKLIGFLEILEPEIILFHPSYYLDLNERDIRKNQLIKSAIALEEAVKGIGATMVIENMLGPKLLAGGGRERPLMRTVEETVEIFNRLPQSIGLAVDSNHIMNSEELIRAMGDRLKTLHIADGTGRAEDHWFPCSGKGENDWSEILSALDEVGYKGPFMYESSPGDEKEYRLCYELLYKKYQEEKGL